MLLAEKPFNLFLSICFFLKTTASILSSLALAMNATEGFRNSLWIPSSVACSQSESEFSSILFGFLIDGPVEVCLF